MWLEPLSGSGTNPYLYVNTDASINISSVTVTQPDGTTITLIESSANIFEGELMSGFGTYTINAFVSGDPDPAQTTLVVDTVKIYENNDFSIPTGSTVTPTNDVQTLLKCAGIFNKPSYTTISDILADATVLLRLMSDNNAVDYLVRSTTFASDICADSTAMTDISANDYCATSLLANSTWRTAICNSTYFETVLNVKIPAMTSATAPSGTVSAMPQSAGYVAGCPPYAAFDGNLSVGWLSYYGSNSESPVTDWVQYAFPAGSDPVLPVKFAYVGKASASPSIYRTAKVDLQGSNDGTNFTSLSGVITLPSMETLYSMVLQSQNKYKYFRVYVTSTKYQCGITEVQVYGRR